MIVYVFMIISTVIMTIGIKKAKKFGKRGLELGCKIMIFLIPFLIMGLRYDVGRDYFYTYAPIFETVKITGEYPTIITCHDDIPGTVSKVSTLFYDNDINIAHMTLVRSQKGKDATMTFEVDNNVSEELIAAIKAVEGVNRVILINSLGGN